MSEQYPNAPNPGSHHVTILQAEYDNLRRDKRKLAALEAAGVDNCEWYDDAMATLDDEP